jgi:AraC-like DNA-binding protein
MKELLDISSNDDDALGCFFEAVDLKIMSTQKLDFTSPWNFRTSEEILSFYIVANGRCRLTIDGKESSIRLNCGDLVVLLNKNIHCLQNDLLRYRRLIGGTQIVSDKAIAPRTTLIRGTFAWNQKEVASLMPEKPPAVHIKCKEGRLLPWMIRAMMMVIDESASNKPGVRAMINYLASVIFIQGILDHLAAVGRNGGQVLQFLNNRQIRPALYLMNAHPEESWSLSSLARKCAMSRSAFAEDFKQSVGRPPMAYLLNLRMDRACDLLSQNILEIKEISEQAGYGSQPAFSNAFKRWTGMAPGAYRKISCR